MRIRGKEERRIGRLEEAKDLKEGRLENWKEGGRIYTQTRRVGGFYLISFISCDFNKFPLISCDFICFGQFGSSYFIWFQNNPHLFILFHTIADIICLQIHNCHVNSKCFIPFRTCSYSCNFAHDFGHVHFISYLFRRCHLCFVLFHIILIIPNGPDALADVGGWMSLVVLSPV